MNTPFMRMRSHRDQSCDLGGDDTHLRRPEHGIATSGDVAADGLNRDMLVSEEDTRKGFRFEGEEGGCSYWVGTQ